MLTRMRYVTSRISPRGKERWYWQRPGHKLVRLPDDATARFTAQERLNKAADRKADTIGDPHASIGWVISTYKADDAYKNLRPGTRKYYDRFINDIEALGRRDPFGDLDRAMVVDFVRSYPKRHQRRQVATVLKNLVGVARYHGLMEADPTTNLRLSRSKPRDRIWTEQEMASWLSAAARWPHMVTALILLRYTAQRPGDVLAMTWGQYDGTDIRLRQQKTGTLLDVPCHPALRDHLDGLKRESLMIVAYKGRAVPYLRFNERFRLICTKTAVSAQARDLRRTAMVAMALAGATVPQIASVSGHSIDSTQRILETYLPRNRDLASAAITKLAEYRKDTNGG